MPNLQGATGRRRGLIGPFLMDRKSPARCSPQHQHLNTGHLPGLEYLKPLTATWMKGMGDLSPSQERAVIKCIALWLSPRS
jgi:hypothetical protein